MGLDGVEIVMKVEEVFNVAIEDSEAGKIATPRQLIDLVLSKVGRTTDQACLTQRAFHRVRASLMQHFNFQRGQIKPETKLGSLFPRSNRIENFRQISRKIGLNKEIEFVRPDWLMGSILLTILFVGIAVAGVLVRYPITSQNQILNLVLQPLPIVAGVLIAIVFGRFIFFATNPMRIEFQPSISTIGNFSRWMVTHAPEVIKVQPGKWSRDQVSEVVREIVLDILGCNKEYREDAHFVKDLGMG